MSLYSNVAGGSININNNNNHSNHNHNHNHVSQNPTGRCYPIATRTVSGSARVRQSAIFRTEQASQLARFYCPFPSSYFDVYRSEASNSCSVVYGNRMFIVPLARTLLSVEHPVSVSPAWPTYQQLVPVVGLGATVAVATTKRRMTTTTTTVAS